MALRIGELEQYLLESGFQEIPEGGVREARLCLNRAACQGAVRLLNGTDHPFLPYRGLPDAWIP
jgi:hypothetical protein